MSDPNVANGALDDLRCGAEVLICGLASKPELNGLVGNISGSLNENGRVPVYLREHKVTILVKPSSLDIDPARVQRAKDTLQAQLQTLIPADESLPVKPTLTTKALAAASVELEEGYPKETMRKVFDPEVQKLLAVPDKKELHRLFKSLPMSKQLFFDIGERSRAKWRVSTVTEETFKRQLELFTWSLFADWDADMWQNVMLAGGAVLASLLPKDQQFKRLKPTPYRQFEFDLYHGRMRPLGEDDPSRTEEQYFRETRWPLADVDLFVYGLDADAAQHKLLKILAHLQRSIVRAHGIQNDVYFVKTSNTITIGCGAVSRTIQVILRLYDDKESILNGFDIDCCCCGFDGSDAWITSRCIVAMSTKINTVNLQIRGECYESRLLKYVERGFAIGLPLLDNSKRDREHLAFTLEKPSWGGDYKELTSGGWSRWGSSIGLERLIMADNIGRLQNGIVERPFPGRCRKGAGHERPMKMKILPYPTGPPNISDGYGGYTEHDKAGNPIWPATTKLDAIKRGEKGFSISWQPGNMPRKPMTWEEWSKTAYVGVERKKDWSFDYKKRREEREAKEKEARAAELDAARKEASAAAEEEMQRTKADLESLRLTAAETEATLKRAKKEEETKARQAAAEKRAAQAKLAKAREDKERLAQQAEEEKSRVEVELARARAAAEQLEMAADEKLCCICLDNDKNVMFEPCRHVSVCDSCAAQVHQCPLCKATPSRKVPVYL